MTDAAPESAPPIDADQLAQARGCEDWNDCYGDCVESAQYALDHWAELDETARQDIRQSAEWVARQKWTESP